MRLIVVNEHTNTCKTVELALPIALHIGAVLNKIMDANGVEHYFTQLGFYDGWGACVHSARSLSQDKETR